MTVRLSDEPGGKKNVPGSFVGGTVHPERLRNGLVGSVAFVVVQALAEWIL